MIDELLHLQAIEMELDSLRRDAESYPKQLEEERHRKKEREELLASARADLENLESEHRELENSLKLEEERLRKSKLKVKELKTNYEFQAMRREIELTQRSNVEMEEQILQKMEAMEATKKLIAEREVEHQNVAEVVSGLEKEVSDKTGAMDELLKAKIEEQESAQKQIDKNILARYYFIRNRRHADALVGVRGGACQGCYMNLPHQMVNEMLRSKTIGTCPTCSRLIYIVADKEEAS